MVTAIIELGIGYFMTYHVPNILDLKGNISKVVKAIGIILLIIGFINIVEAVANYLHIN